MANNSGAFILEARRHLRKLAVLLAVLAVLYALLHIQVCEIKGGDEYVKLDEHDIQMIAAILMEQDTPPAPSACGTGRDCVINYLDGRFYKWIQDDKDKHLYLINRLSDKALLTYLGNARFNVRSFFWLTGSKALFEIIFWTLFGVICNILFTISDALTRYTRALREGADNAGPTAFDPNEVPNYRIRLLFAPFVSIVLVLGYQFFTDEEQGGYLETSKGIVVISFLLGFYSSRAMRMLDKVKEVLLPFAGDPPAGAKPLPGELSEVSVSLLLDDAVRSKNAAHLPALLNELDAATVLLRDTTSGKEVTLTAEGPEQERVFKGKLPPGEYTIVAVANTSTGVNLLGEEALTVRGAKQDVSIKMKESGGAG
mgnify:CR=1 FL=1